MRIDEFIGRIGLLVEFLLATIGRLCKNNKNPQTAFRSLLATGKNFLSIT